MLKRSLTTVAVLAGLLAAAAPAHAGTFVGNPGDRSAVIESVGTKYTMFAGDAYTNEMGVHTANRPS